MGNLFPVLLWTPENRLSLSPEATFFCHRIVTFHPRVEVRSSEMGVRRWEPGRREGDVLRTGRPRTSAPKARSQKSEVGRRSLELAIDAEKPAPGPRLRRRPWQRPPVPRRAKQPRPPPDHPLHSIPHRNPTSNRQPPARRSSLCKPSSHTSSQPSSPPFRQPSNPTYPRVPILTSQASPDLQNSMFAAHDSPVINEARVGLGLGLGARAGAGAGARARAGAPHLPSPISPLVLLPSYF
jgi:hypothetical protein